MTTTAEFVPALEAELFRLYANANLEEAAREYRAWLAELYHVATGRWFAARFYY
jgi:hypothetical protein